MRRAGGGSRDERLPLPLREGVGGRGANLEGQQKYAPLPPTPSLKGRGRSALLLASLFLSTAAAPPPGASSCSGCHAPASATTGIPAIAGQPADHLAAELESFRDGSRPATVMTRIVKGFTPDQLQAIADWWAAQK
jgi:cytochrome c553